MAQHPDPPLPLILASGSPYRRKLLSRLEIAFSCEAPQVDETPREGESAAALALRLAVRKARDVAARHPRALVIGSDQVAELDGRLLGKPGTVDRAVEQLAAASGRTVTFHTGLCLVNTVSDSETAVTDRFTVTFRHLSEAQIRSYVERERPLDCAGSFKAEGLGIALFQRMSGNDPNTLIGLPLIALVSLLEQEGYPVL